MATQSFSLIVKNTFIDVDEDEDIPAKVVPLKRAVTAPAAWKGDQSVSLRRLSDAATDVSTSAPSSDTEEDQASQISESPCCMSNGGSVCVGRHCEYSTECLAPSPCCMSNGGSVCVGRYCEYSTECQAPTPRCMSNGGSVCVGRHCPYSTVCHAPVPAVYGQWHPMYGQWQLPHARDAQWKPTWAMGEGGQCEMAVTLPAPLLSAGVQAVDTKFDAYQSPHAGQPEQNHEQCRPTLHSIPQAACRQATSSASAEEEWESVEKVAAFQPQTLSRWRSRITGATRIVWTVDGKKFRGSDRLTVSPGFLLADGHGNAPLPFKMVMNPQGGGSFRKAQGKGIVQLKCEAPRQGQESTTFHFSIGSGHRPDPRLQAPRGPVTHNFGQSGICGLPKNCEVWDFSQVLDEKSQTCVVILDVGATDTRMGK